MLHAALAVACCALPARAQSFAERLNPTGDPIGGGPGYSDIKSPATADFVVSDAAGLLAALAQAEAGQVVYVDDAAEIDLTDKHDVVIPGGVTLASGRGRNGSEGGLIFSNAMHPDADLVPVFVTGGPGVRITGLRLRGPSAEIGDHHYELNGVAILLRVMYGHDGVEVDNCEIWAWDKWALWLYYSNGAHVHHNAFHHTQRAGYGEHIWCGGSGSETGSEALIEANFFDYGRHFIGSSGHLNSWEARYNIAGSHTTGHRFDRHGGGGLAGLDTRVHHNWFIGGRGEDVAVRAEPDGEFSYYANWTDHATLEAAVRLDAPGGLENEHFVAYDNTFGGVPDAWLPTAVVSASPASGSAPLTVHFNGGASSDPNGYAITQHLWAFGDGHDAVGATARGATAEHTFEAPGRYGVELAAINEFGIPGTTLSPFIVEPSREGYVLSAWLQDSYGGPLKGYYRKQILIDDRVVWEDDVAGEEGWQHVVLDVGGVVQGESSVRITFRLYADEPVTDPENQIVEAFMYVDDVHLFGGNVRDGGMEEMGRWFTATGREGGGTSSGWNQTYFGVGRSGIRALMVGRGHRSTSEADTWAEWYQDVSVSALAPVGRSIGLTQGWNLVAADVWPEDPRLEAVFADVLPQIGFVEDAEGRRFEPGGVNEIGDWDPLQAYYVYALAQVTLEVEGVPVVPEAAAITLREGWNAVPYLGAATRLTSEALASVADDLVLAKDHTGEAYFPAGGIGTLEELEPGRGYSLYMERSGELIYPPDAH